MRIRLARWIMRTAAKVAWNVGGHAAFEMDISQFYARYTEGA